MAAVLRGAERGAQVSPGPVPGGAGRPALVLLAHGSRDPRAAMTTEDLALAVSAARPGLDVRVAYLDHAWPRPGEVLAALAASGAPSAVVVPLLLTSAYHGTVDVPAVLADPPLPVHRAPIVGADRLLYPALLRGVRSALRARFPVVGYAGAPRFPTALPGADPTGLSALRSGADRTALSTLRSGEAARWLPPQAGRTLPAQAGRTLPIQARSGSRTPPGGAPCDGLVVIAAGTSDDAARAGLAVVAAELGEWLGVPARIGFASGPGPGADRAVAALHAAGAHRVGVASCFLAPGRLYDKARDRALRAGAVTVAEPLGAAPELVELVLTRYAAAVSAPLPAVA
ncbi:CbiX/SirB N-terminal domain-containing protein [Longispora sp. K20-0274]|uniref:sirohydrochlorin chelatase n=1 Tax=Longispora sp. K20-0274 TaxID=3088255 RepID=UPI00399BAD1A